MSFTIKCDKCGSENTFTSDSKKYQENIGISVYVEGSYMGDVVKEIQIDCENPNCNNSIEIKY